MISNSIILTSFIEYTSTRNTTPLSNVGDQSFVPKKKRRQVLLKNQKTLGGNNQKEPKNVRFTIIFRTSLQWRGKEGWHVQLSLELCSLSSTSFRVIERRIRLQPRWRCQRLLKRRSLPRGIESSPLTPSRSQRRELSHLQGHPCLLQLKGSWATLPSWEGIFVTLLVVITFSTHYEKY